MASIEAFLDISIHLMLLFIISDRLSAGRELNFNTSHVTVYPFESFTGQMQQRNFNTSHVTVYLKLIIPVPILERFQYISCYCLSVWFNIFVPPVYYFNTSHVTVYLCQNGTSCNHSIISIHLMLLFIQMDRKETKVSIQISIHLMLLFI